MLEQDAVWLQLFGKRNDAQPIKQTDPGMQARASRETQSIMPDVVSAQRPVTPVEHAKQRVR
jgi:hypothetical protein